jgi:hypothetical protein
MGNKRVCKLFQDIYSLRRDKIPREMNMIKRTAIGNIPCQFFVYYNGIYGKWVVLMSSLQTE